MTMECAEIIIRTAETEDGALIATAIANGLSRLGFESVSNNVVGALDCGDPELLQAMETINPEIFALPVEIVYDALPPAGAVDPDPVFDELDTEVEDGETEE